MKAYLGTYSDASKYQTHNINFEVGSTYTINGDYDFVTPIFSVFPDPDNAILFNTYNKNFKLLEVEAYDDFYNSEIYPNSLNIAKKIKIIREIPKSEYKTLLKDSEFDDRYNLIHRKNNLFDTWFEYDDLDRLIKYKQTSSGFEEWYEYDDRNNLIYSLNSYGYKFWNTYNEHNKLVYSKDSDGHEMWHEYDDNQNEIHYRDNWGTEFFTNYDENDNKISHVSDDGLQKYCCYDSKNNLIHSKDNNGSEFFYCYDGHNRVIYDKMIINGSAYEKWYGYDDKNNVIYSKTKSLEAVREYTIQIEMEG